MLILTFPFWPKLLLLTRVLIKTSKTYSLKASLPKHYYASPPEGKSAIALSFIYKKESIDSIPEFSGEQLFYNNTAITIAQKDQRKIYSASIEGIQIVTTSQLVLENSIRNLQNKRPGIQNHYFFDLAQISDDNAPMSVLLHQDFKEVLQKLFPKTPFFPSLGSSWFSFDFNTKKDPFTLDGVSFINDSIPDELTLVKGLNPKRITSTAFIPQNFDAFLALAVNDYKTLEDNFKQYSRYKNIALPEINFDLLSAIDEIAWLKLQENKALLFRLINDENINPLLFSQKVSSGSYRGQELFNQKLPQDLLTLLETYGMLTNPKWGVQLESFVIFAEDKTFLKQIIGAYLDGKTLENDLNFKNLNDDLADNSTFLWLGKTKNLISIWNKSFEESSGGVEKNRSKKIPTACATRSF